MYYEKFETLLKENDLKPADISKATGISTATLTNWKKGEYTPKTDKLDLICKFFNVEMSYFTGKEEQYTDEKAHMLAKIATNVELSNAMLKYFELSDKKKRHVLELIDLLSEK